MPAPPAGGRDGDFPDQAPTNTVTNLATANSDSIPLVVITGQVPSKLIGNDAFQEVDIVGITRSCTSTTSWSRM